MTAIKTHRAIDQVACPERRESEFAVEWIHLAGMILVLGNRIKGWVKRV